MKNDGTKRLAVKSWLVDMVDGEVVLIGFGFELGTNSIKKEAFNCRFSAAEILEKGFKQADRHIYGGASLLISGEAVMFKFMDEKTGGAFVEQMVAVAKRVDTCNFIDSFNLETERVANNG